MGLELLCVAAHDSPVTTQVTIFRPRIALALFKTEFAETEEFMSLRFEVKRDEL
jgi:hypothetical protein